MLVALIILLAATALVLPSTLQNRRVRNQIAQTDHASMLSACRWMIENQNQFKDEPCGIWNGKGRTCINADSQQWSHSVPDHIKNFAPAHFLVISTNELMIYVNTIPRTVILAFPKGAKQRGTTKLIDGLWIWMGDTKDK